MESSSHTHVKDQVWKKKKNLQHQHLLCINASFHPAVRVWERILSVKQDEFKVV